MNSKLLAASVVAIGVLGSGVATAMDFSVYGSIRGGYYQKETDDTMQLTDASATLNDDEEITEVLNPGSLATEADTSGRDASSVGATGFDGSSETYSRFGIKGSEDFGNGGSAGFHIERATGSADSLTGRLEYVWIKGNWGQLTLGQQDNPYRNAANWDQTWFFGGNNRFDDGGSRLEGIKYNNAFGPFSFSLTATGNDADGAEGAWTTLVNEADGTTIHAMERLTVTGPAVEDEDGLDSFIGTAHYVFGDIATINLGWQTNNQDSNEPGVSYDNTVISANGGFGPIGWYIAYEENEDNVGTPTVTIRDDNAARASDGATLVNQVANNYQQDAETVAVFLSAALSERDLVYLQWEDSSVDGHDDLLQQNLDKDATVVGYSRKIGPHTSFIAEYATVSSDSDAVADNDRLLAVLKVDF